jgi:hypothetical protein
LSGNELRPCSNAGLTHTTINRGTDGVFDMGVFSVLTDGLAAGWRMWTGEWGLARMC